MKNAIATLGLIVLTALSGMAQQRNIYFRVNHLADAAPLSYSKTYVNDLGQSYQFTRIEYFITNISLGTDTGQTFLSDSVLLINAAKTAEYELGTTDLLDVDSLKFHFGVDEDRNHMDPSKNPAGHPLAPRNEYSMHWDWASGYRFWAVEGEADTSGDGIVDVTFQYHIAFDRNFVAAALATKVEDNTDIRYFLNIDYAKLLGGIDLKAERFVHGGNGGPYDTPLDSMLVRLRERSCYSSGDQALLNVDGDLRKSSFRVFPNPAHQSIRIESESVLSQVRITDTQGRLVSAYEGFNGQTAQISVSQIPPGVYLVTVIDQNRHQVTSKLLIH